MMTAFIVLAAVISIIAYEVYDTREKLLERIEVCEHNCGQYHDVFTGNMSATVCVCENGAFTDDPATGPPQYAPFEEAATLL
jgi:hypothetical protein